VQHCPGSLPQHNCSACQAEGMRPVIALPSRFSDKADTWRVPATSLGRTYQEALVRAGAQPVAIPPIPASLPDLAETLSRFDGLCLPGGPDVDPARYGATDVHPTVYGVNADHDALDIGLARAAVALGMPILAICRGHQVLNVAMGGSLVQHIGDDEAVRHRFQRNEHELTAGSLAALAMGTTQPVGHCVHHQVIDRLAEGLVVTGRALDGHIEAVEGASGWIVGVQWHPEDDAAEIEQQQRLFDAFVLACRSWRESQSPDPLRA
jgi:putative glutamine amidotransferase